MQIRRALRVGAVLLVTAMGWGAGAVTLAGWARTLAAPLVAGRAAGDAAVDAVAGTAAALAVLAVTTWFALSLAGAVLATARQGGGPPGRPRAIGAGTRAPVAVRRLAALLLGAGLAAAPAGAAGASAATGGSGPDRPAAVASLDRPAPRAPIAVRVRPGDSLWVIAARHLGADPPDADVARAWPRWHDANRARIGADPDLLVPGQLLHPPTTEESR